MVEYSREAHSCPVVDAEKTTLVHSNKTISASCSSRVRRSYVADTSNETNSNNSGQLGFASRESLAGINVTHMAEDSTQLPNNYTRTRKWSSVNRNTEKETGGCWKEVQVKARSEQERERERDRGRKQPENYCVRVDDDDDPNCVSRIVHRGKTIRRAVSFSERSFSLVVFARSMMKC